MTDLPAQSAFVEVLAPLLSQAAAFDLGNYDIERAASARLLPAQACSADDADEIVVCAPDAAQFRLKRGPSRFERRDTNVTADIESGLTVTPHVEAATLGGGVQSNRVMVTIKLKL